MNKTLLFYTRSMGDKNDSFAKAVEDTEEGCTSTWEHKEKMALRYPKYKIVPVYTFRHGNYTQLQLLPTCRFESSHTGFAAYKEGSEAKLKKKIKELNDLFDAEYEGVA